MRYRSTISYASWPTERHHESFNKKMVRNRSFQKHFDNYVSSNETTLNNAINKNFLKISCYLGTYKQTVLEDKEKSNVINLFSEMGSILNLWCGITIAFLGEIIELLCRLISHWAGGKNINAKSTKS